MEKEDFVGEWKCITCQDNMQTNEIPKGVLIKNNEGNFDEVNSPSLANEINKSIIHENEELKQELHIAKNNSSLYVLELEDKIQHDEETIESQKKSFDKREKELISQIQSLEKKLKNEKEDNENLISIIEEETENELRKENKQLKKINGELRNKLKELNEQKKKHPKTQQDYQTQIILEELKKEKLESENLRTASKIIQEEIRCLENKIQEIQTSKRTCLSCFPAIQQSHSNVDLSGSSSPWITQSRRGAGWPKHPQSPQGLQCTNGFSPLAVADEEEEEDDVGDKEVSQSEYYIYGDSQGRDLAYHINQKRKNETSEALEGLTHMLNKYQHTNIVLVDLPNRYDLKSWSCVNKEVRKTNISLEELCRQHPNVTLVKASEAERHFHTRQGMHYNYRGKVWLAEKISKAINKMASNAQSQALVNMELSLNEEELSEKYTEQGGAELQGSSLKRHEGMKHRATLNCSSPLRLAWN
ncbi:hypothetical protein J6590_055104 [Homalodisca vitripennis]|nr:hypothetical protein J6590_055104 [Homalodisca vitripennis]